MKISGYRTVDEAAKILDLDVATVRRYVLRGRLAAEKIGLLISDAEIARFRKNRRRVGRPATKKEKPAIDAGSRCV